MVLFFWGNFLKRGNAMCCIGGLWRAKTKGEVEMEMRSGKARLCTHRGGGTENDIDVELMIFRALQKFLETYATFVLLVWYSMISTNV